MPGPGDPNDSDNDDDLIGFVSPASLQGQSRRAPQTRPESAPEPAEAPERDAPVLRPAFAERPTPVRDQVRAASAADAFAPRPASPETSMRPRERTRAAETDNFTLTIYLLILMTVPTLAAAGVIALVAVWKRPPPADPLARSHFVYQQRTLVAGAIAAVVGVVLLAAPFALGVTLLFGLALWLLARGAAGVWKLKAGRAIENPMAWWI